MILISFFVMSTLIWQDDFTEMMTPINQLFDYTIDITHERGKILLQAHPQCGDFASAWLSVDEDLVLDDEDVLEVIIKVNDNEVGFRYYYLKGGGEVYFFGERTISAHAEWQHVDIPFKEAKPLYGSDFPAALTPGKLPCLYIFMRNELPGNFDVEIDRISLWREILPEEEQ